MSDDRSQIENLLARYARTYDDGDFASYGELFRYGEITNATGRLCGPAEVTEHHRRHCVLHNGKPNTRHVTTNLNIEIDAGGLTASADSYVTVFQAAPNFPLQVICVASYFDKFHKIDGQWWFKSRLVETHLLGDVSKHANNSVLDPTHIMP
jgi:3-phenylpropionate/cinnamic acid dioxygenase small subunit